MSWKHRVCTQDDAGCETWNLVYIFNQERSNLYFTWNIILLHIDICVYTIDIYVYTFRSIYIYKIGGVYMIMLS